MRRLALVATCTALGACGTANDLSGATSQDAAIINGTSAPTLIGLSEQEQRAVGALLNPSGNRWVNGCTGTLVSPTVVLTAAHCVLDERGRTLSTNQLAFSVGPNASAPLYRQSPQQIIAHPNYDEYSTRDNHDVAVLLFDQPFPNVTPLPINCDSLPQTLQGQAVQNVGYGATQNSDSNATRYWVAQDVTQLTNYDFTVDGYSNAGMCFGDSGGPSLWEMPNGQVRVIGVLSWGDANCANRDHFGRVDLNCDFLEDFVETQPTQAVVIEGVAFTAQQAASTLQWVNTASLKVLDDDVALDSRAANNIIANRPFASLSELALVSYVGPSALTKLRDFTQIEASSQSPAGLQ